MRVPLSWLGEFVELAPGTTPEDVHAVLVRVGLEEEAIHRAELSGPIVVGQVLDFVEEPQKNGKTIRWCQVLVAPEGERAADGGDAVHGIVCGAGNFHVGDKVVVTLPGATLPGPFPIAARKTYGHVSEGMIASSRELGLGDEHDGILRLVELGLDPEVGADAVALLGLDDSAVEINVTPDRGYALSIRGVAREYAHSVAVPFDDPAERIDATPGEGFDVEVDNSVPLRGREPVHSFATRVVTGIDATRPTPRWMGSRLALAGIRSVSLPVDITNYVMVELGQPIHGYDLATVGAGFGVRRAAEGETLVTLDGVERELDGEDLVIVDASGPIGLAGVMGGARTEMTDATTDVLIEAAGFDPVSIARTVRRHKLPSEASRRFERGVDPEVAVRAANRVGELLVELAGGTLSGRGSSFRNGASPVSVHLPSELPSRLVGVDYAPERSEQILTEIGATVERVPGGWDVTPPSWRPDLIGAAELVEEIVRIDGYEKIPFRLPVAPPGRGLTRSQRLRRLSADVLAAAGSVEVLAYPFVSPADNALFGSADDVAPAAVTVVNALDQSAAQLRTSVLPGLVEVAARNLSRGATDQSIFEIGAVFLPSAELGTAALPAAARRPSDAELDALSAGIPDQPRHLGALVLGQRRPSQFGLDAERAGIADAWTLVDRLVSALGGRAELVQGAHHAFHPGRTAEVFVGGRRIGVLGELHPEVTAAHHLPRVVAAVEIDLDALIDAVPVVPQADRLSTFPVATQDLSLVVSVDVAAGDVRRSIVAGAGELLESVRLVDDYRGDGVDEGLTSLTFALRFRAPDRTLTAAEASEAKLAGARRAASDWNAVVRD
ncbi:phenylalanine--tRNA ligase subunit beta [Mycetocola reblochoni]|uniref:Phenylalanine--tRNA ligase beta subunit n=2 Tax=Mycetocola reblochoni TaxID=331618 RepID=A0A1R4IDR9_9MICO|nr:phenylalanine--tRNA ligase subunit beta [Mycetocola reblochoni]RLP68140.1 phenylalanine--tRNA ligase subunit beta [Mycetocola reblochoni]SJN17985.1 Phenylalanyl-tRNA synthetase beta chain [Mycetocola reblochoni REB411]